MKLLLDANISWRLATILKSHFEDCIHVDHCTLVSPARDLDILEFATANKLIIVSNDEDFLNLVNLKGFPLKLFCLKRVISPMYI
jgi:predicted nuclease of predicted toxin-antitoxin system